MIQFILIIQMFKTIKEDYSKIGKVFVYPLAFIWSIIWSVSAFIELILIDIPAYLLNLCKKYRETNFIDFIRGLWS